MASISGALGSDPGSAQGITTELTAMVYSSGDLEFRSSGLQSVSDLEERCFQAATLRLSLTGRGGVSKAVSSQEDFKIAIESSGLGSGCPSVK